MSTLSKSEASVLPGCDNNVSLGAEEIGQEVDRDALVSSRPKSTHRRHRQGRSSVMISPSEKSLRNKMGASTRSLYNKKTNKSSLSLNSFVGEQEDLASLAQNETYHFEETDQVINIESNNSSMQELALSSTSFSGFGKYERAETANEEDIAAAHQFMFSLAKVRIYMD